MFYNKLTKFALLSILVLSIGCGAAVIESAGPSESELEALALADMTMELNKNMSLAYSAEQGKDFENALIKYKIAIDLDKKINGDKLKFAYAYKKVGNIYYLQHKDYTKTLEYFSEGLKHSPDDIGMLQISAYIYQEQKDYDKYIPAAKQLLPLLTDDNTKIAYLQNLKSFYKQKQEFEEALKMIEELIKLNPNSNNLATERVNMLQLARGTDAVIQEVEALHMANPTDMDLISQLIGHYLGNSDYTKALAMIDKGLVNIPGDIDMLETKLAIYTNNMQDEEKIVDSLNELIKAVPEEASYVTSIAQIHLENGKFETAANIATRALRVTAGYGEANYIIGQALRQQVSDVKTGGLSFDDKLVNEKAMYYYKQAYKDDVTKSKAQNYIEYLELEQIPSESDRFMNKGHVKPKHPKYQWTLKYRSK